MISALNLKLSKVIVVAIAAFNIIFVLGILDYFWQLSNIDYNYHAETLKNVPNYLSNKPIENSHIEKGNVQFRFTNPKRKYGSPEQILDKNSKIYNSMFTKKISEPQDIDVNLIRPPERDGDGNIIGNYDHANATIIALVRNTEALSIGKSIRLFEKRFNEKFKYPYTFINDQPFNDKFKKKIEKYTSAPINYVTIPSELWDKPKDIDTKTQKERMKKLKEENIAYAQMESYHNMCRFYLGNFFNVPELQNYRYYWRIEPNVKFYSDLNYDVFKYMELTEKIYGFTISLYDIHQTVKTLWPETMKFLNSGDNYKYVNDNAAVEWLLENQQHPEKNAATGGYSTCHFWSNFEIGDMDFFRGEAYTQWFKHLDESGGFYYERWGDAPVHSIGVSLFGDKSKVHWFRDIGYFHDPYLNCPNADNTDLCDVGKSSRYKHLLDQNCVPSWIDYSMDDPNKYYTFID